MRAMAVVVVLVLAGCTSSSQPDVAPGTTTPSTVHIDPIVLRPDVDLGTQDQSARRVLVGSDAPEVVIGFQFDAPVHPGPALLEFPALEVEPDCVDHATLRISLDPADSPATFAAYPVRPGAWPGAPEDGTSIPRWLLLDNRPRGVFSRVGDRLEADVTELVRTWVRGGPFPSNGATIDERAPLLLAIQLASAARDETYRLAMSERPEAGPTLTVRPCRPTG